jgi:hypothetical protein
VKCPPVVHWRTANMNTNLIKNTNGEYLTEITDFRSLKLHNKCGETLNQGIMNGTFYKNVINTFTGVFTSLEFFLPLSV